MKPKKYFQRFLWIIGIVTCSSIISFAQDLHFSQFNMSPLSQNPSLAGALYDKQALINYKNQWNSVTYPYTTFAASYDMTLSKKKVKKGFWGGGINFSKDNAGASQMGTLQANLSIAYHIYLNEYNTLGAGIQGGLAQRSINYGGLQSGNQFDGRSYNAALPIGETFGLPSYTYIDVATGIVWTYKNTAGTVKVTDNHELKANAGFSVFHITQPKYSYFGNGENLHLKYVFHGNSLISLPNSNLALVPSFMYSIQGASKELLMGSLIRYKLKQDSKYTGTNKGAAFSIGTFFRTKDAVIATMLLEFSNYAIGMSYDLNTSQLLTVSKGRGGFEITLRFLTPNPF